MLRVQGRLTIMLRNFFESDGDEIAEVADILRGHPQGMDVGRRSLTTAATSLVDAARAWQAELRTQETAKL
eukprot:SAG31_NODE_10720_length_1106_cov_1.321748_1_plen_71_part_00